MRQPRVKSVLATVGAAAIFFNIASSGALGSESVSAGFAGHEDAVVNEIHLDFADDRDEAGTPVRGVGVLERAPGRGEDCIPAETFEFTGRVQSPASGGITQVRGAVERFSHGCNDDHSAQGTFEVTISDDGSVSGSITFPDEAEPRRITNAIAAGTPGGSTSSAGDPLGLSIFASSSAIALVAAIVCVMKGRRIHGLLGAAASAATAALTFEAMSIDSGVMEGAVLFVLYALIALPLIVLVGVVALRPAKPSSWWADRRSPA